MGEVLEFSPEQVNKTKREQNDKLAREANSHFQELIGEYYDLYHGKKLPKDISAIIERLMNYAKAINIYLNPPFKYETTPPVESREAFKNHPDYNILMCRPNVAGTPLQAIELVTMDEVLPEHEHDVVAKTLNDAQRLLRSLKGDHMFFSQEEIESIKKFYVSVRHILNQEVVELILSKKRAA